MKQKSEGEKNPKEFDTELPKVSIEIKACFKVAFKVPEIIDLILMSLIMKKLLKEKMPFQRKSKRIYLWLFIEMKFKCPQVMKST